MSLTVVIHKDAPNPVIEIPNWTIHDKTALQFTGAVYLTALGKDYTRHNLDLSNPAMKQLFFQTIDRACDAKIVRMRRLVHQISIFTKLRKVFLACLIATIFAYVFSLISFTTSAILFLLIGKALKWRDNASEECKDTYEAEAPKAQVRLSEPRIPLQVIEHKFLRLKNRELFESIAKTISRYSRVSAQFHRENCEILKKFKDNKYEGNSITYIQQHHHTQNDEAITLECDSFSEYPLTINPKSRNAPYNWIQEEENEDPLIHAYTLTQNWLVFHRGSYYPSTLIYSIDALSKTVLRDLVLNTTVRTLPTVIIQLIQEYAQPDNHTGIFSLITYVVNANVISSARHSLIPAENETQKKEASTVAS